MSSIPAGQWANPSYGPPSCDLVGCSQPAVMEFNVIWLLSTEVWEPLRACSNHENWALHYVDYVMEVQQDSQLIQDALA